MDITTLQQLAALLEWDIPVLEDHAARLVEEAVVEITALRTKLVQASEAAFTHVAYYCDDETFGSRRGWYDTMSLQLACDLGDLLVELGKWERQIGGTGRKRYYRPLPTQ
jgi:hypothetical protein